MNIIISGAGKVGFNLARTLSIGHNVIIIDNNKEAVLRIQESLDILPYFGAIKDPKTYEEFIDMDIDLYIAVTNSDEANILSCMAIDSVLKVKKKLLRLHNTFYKNTNIKEQLGIDSYIFPLERSSKSIKTLLDFPKVNNIKSFKYTDYKLISIFAKKSFTFDSLEKALDDSSEKLIGIERDKKFYVTQSDDICKNDLLYLFVKEENIQKVCDIFEDTAHHDIKNCVVFGAGELGISISKVLLENKREIKIVDSDIQNCRVAEEKLQGRVEVINSKYHKNEVLFVDERLNQADIFISTNKNDEYNIIKSLEAKEFGIKKIVAINNESEYYNLMHSLGLVAVRGPKMSAYHTIMEMINSSKIIIEKRFCGGRGVLFMRKIFKDSHLLNKTISPLDKDDINSFMIEDGILKKLDPNKPLKEDDIIIVISTQEDEPKVKSWIYGL